MSLNIIEKGAPIGFPPLWDGRTSLAIGTGTDHPTQMPKIG